mmetsp:Transcript_4858/g.11070  ORF Transcript_4858/g.11070 Transcript_4858/m.11070 type:complete len:519 (+) Transcript_4858:127-1683(+)
MKLFSVFYSSVFTTTTLALVDSTSALPRNLRADGSDKVNSDDRAYLLSDLSMPTNSDTSSFTDGSQVAEVAATRDVCIVGGGPAGTYAAHLLEEKGYSTALFDEAHRLGGKTVPYGEDDLMFRHVLTSDMTLAIKFIEKFGLEDYKANRKNQNLCYDDQPESVVPVSRKNFWENMRLGVPSGLSAEATVAMLKYIAIWNDYEDVITQFNHDNVPDELKEPADEWLAGNDLVAITQIPMFYNGLSNYGYSFLSEIPAIYLLKYISPTKLIEDSDTWFPFHLMIERLGSNLKDVNLNTRVERIQQETDETWKLYAKGLNEKELSYICDQVILAFPPTAEALDIIDELHPATKELFNDIHVVPYWEAIISDLPYCSPRDYLSCLARDNFYFRAPSISDRLSPSHNIPNVYGAFGESNEVFVLFNGGSKDFDQEDIFDIIHGHLHAAFGYDPDDYNVELYKKWPYFPHVNPDAMKDGFYNKLEDAQGVQNLYFTGGFRDFELVDNTMRTTEDLLDRYFPSKY